MDDRRFDSMSRLLAQGASRRAVLRGLLAGGAGKFAASTFAVAAKSEKVTICTYGDEGYVTKDVPAQTVARWEAKGYTVATICDGDVMCGGCCEVGHSCTSGSECCSERCLDSGFCGGTCYCYTRYNEAEQADFGELCLSGSGWTCGVGCTSSAECGSDAVCIFDPDNPLCSSTGVCATTFYGPCDY